MRNPIPLARANVMVASMITKRVRISVLTNNFERANLHAEPKPCSESNLE